jgi:hypothetical protein
MSGGLHERLERKRAEEAQRNGTALPSEFNADGTRKPAWVIRAERGQLPSQRDLPGQPGDPNDSRR